MARLTKRFLERQTLPQNKTRVEFRDDAFDGEFGVRITRNRKTFFCAYVDPSGIRRRVTVGYFPAVDVQQAKTRARKVLEKVARPRPCVEGLWFAQEGPDGWVVPQVVTGGMTFVELFDCYLEEAKTRKKSWKQDRWMYQAILKPEWGERQAAGITKQEVAQLLARVVKNRGGTTANRTHSFVRAVYSWAQKSGLLDYNPGVIARPAKEKSRERLLEPSEIRILWSVASEYFHPAAAVYLLRLTTAQRGRPLLGLRRQDISELDEQGGAWWTIPADQMKAGKTHRVYLTPLTMEVLPEPQDNGLYFPNRNEPIQPLKSLHHFHSKIVEEAKERGLTKWVQSDLRRTAATLMAKNGVSRPIVRRVLAHADSEITSVYDMYSYDREVKEAMLKLEESLRSIVSEEGSMSE